VTEFTADELLTMTERALERLDWGQVHALASDVLALQPGNTEAAMLRSLADRHGGRSSLPGRRQATALVVDLVESTPLAERYDVEVYGSVLRAFELACRPVVEKHEGQLVDVQGDAIVACFGYPLAHEDDASRAVSAGLDLLAALRPVATRLRAELGVELHTRIGIDTGIVVIDGVGVLGPALNRAARLQALAASDTVLISATTNEMVAGRFDTQPLGPMELKGVDAPIEVYRVIGRRDPAGRARALRSTSLPFIGRDAELQQVLELWDRAPAAQRNGENAGEPSQASLVLITGEPGIGKSRLASAVLQHVVEAGARVFEVYCSSYSVTSTLYPVRTAIERYANMSSDGTSAERLARLETRLADLPVDLAEIIPALSVILDLETADRFPVVELAPIQLRELLLERLVDMVRASASAQPLVVLFEDLHWADPTTLELLDRMAVATVRTRLLILGTARTGLAWVRDHDEALQVRLGQLPDAEARQLALAAAPHAISVDDAREIAARGDGVPLFVEELAHALGGGNSAVSGDTVPPTLTQLLQARLDSIGYSKLVAQVAATVGREFDQSVLEDVMGKLRDLRAAEAEMVSVGDHLDRLLDAQLIEPTGHEGLLRFRHVLVRDAAYQAQLMSDRKARHLATAQVLAEAKAADPALKAFHFDHAGRPEEALVYYLQATARAKAAGSFAEVLAHTSRCESLLPMIANETVRAQFELTVRLGRGLAVSSTAGYAAPAAVEDFGRARDLCDQLRDVPGVGTELLKALFGLWTYYCARGHFDVAGSIAAAIDRQLDGTAIYAGRGGVHACRGVEAFYRGNLQQAGDLLTRAVEAIPRDDADPTEWPLPNDPLAAACAFLGPLHFLTGDLAAALRAIHTGMVRSESLEFPIGPFSVAFVRTYEAQLHRARGDVQAATAAAEEVVRIGARHGFFDWQMVGRMHLAAARAMTDSSSDALNEMDDAITTWCAVGGAALIPWLRVEQAAGYLARDDADNAMRCLDHAFQVMAGGQRLALPEALRVRAELRLRADPAAEPSAEADLREAVAVARAQGSAYSVLRAALSRRRLLDGGADDLTDSALAEAVAAYGDATDFPELAEARELIATGSRRVSLG
jgi:class 3 adenylate cyclase/tetratricopeptide (TPR) repeat protein/nucleoside-triphosphatase THEP1